MHNIFLLILINQVSHGRVVELDVNLPNADRLENHAGVCDDIFGINVFADFELDGADEEVAAQRPEVRFLDGINTGQASDLLVAPGQDSV